MRLESICVLLKCAKVFLDRCTHKREWLSHKLACRCWSCLVRLDQSESAAPIIFFFYVYLARTLNKTKSLT